MAEIAEGHVMTDEEEQALLPAVRRKDWQINQQKLSSAMISYFRDNLKQPTDAELAKLTGLGQRTVERHMKDIDYAELFLVQRERFAQLSPNVLMAIYNSALKGSAKAQEMMLQVIFGWASPKFYDPPTPEAQNNEEELKQLDQGIEMLLAMRERQKDKYGDRAAAEDPTTQRTTP